MIYNPYLRQKRRASAMAQWLWGRLAGLGEVQLTVNARAALEWVQAFELCWISMAR